MRTTQEAALRPFSASGYEILDEDLPTLGQVVIWSVAPQTPRLGDTFTVESGGEIHEVVVNELITFKGGWSARCKIFGFVA